jgi:LPXTG-site transpeptidase (sortase) family protein
VARERTQPEHAAERGDHRPWWLAALGIALATGGVVLATTTLPSQQSADPVDTRPALAPYVLQPEVVLEASAKTGEPEPSPHPATGFPNRLLVPKLGIDAPVVRAHVTDGTLWPPDDPQTLGWWAEGAAPGAVRGGALITGHSVSTGGGAFDDLETLRKGDQVGVRTGRGVIDYTVTGVTIYKKGALAEDAERVFSQEGPGRLVLITCEDYNGSYWESNAIVFAERGT